MCPLCSGAGFFGWKWVLSRVTFFNKKTSFFQVTYGGDTSTFSIFMRFHIWVSLSLLNIVWISIFWKEPFLGLQQLPKYTLLRNPKYCSSAEDFVSTLQQQSLLTKDEMLHYTICFTGANFRVTEGIWDIRYQFKEAGSKILIFISDWKKYLTWGHYFSLLKKIINFHVVQSEILYTGWIFRVTQVVQ